MKKIFLSFLVVLFFCNLSFAQHEAGEIFHPHSSLGIVVSHTNVSQGQQDGDTKWLSLPSWSLNYNYKFKPRWSIGVHTDIVTENFEVEEHLNNETNTTLERSYPVSVAAMASFKPGKHFSLLLGAGGEFAHTGNLFLIRVGAEYVYEMNSKWELNAMITDDIKINAYNSWAIGLGVTMVF
jgi:opacity protein-like surface antigen